MNGYGDVLERIRHKSVNDSQSDPDLEGGIFQSQPTQNSEPEEPHDMVTGVHEEVTYCSPTTYSGKQNRNRSTSQPLFTTEHNLTTFEADQKFLALQQLAINNKPANFHNNITTEFPSCKTCAPQRCPRLTGSSRSLSCLKTSFNEASKVTTSYRS